MKRYNNLFEKIVTMDNLLIAHKNASRGKSKYKEVIEINKDPEKYCRIIQDMLVNGKFTTSKYDIKYKNDRGKIREIYVLPYFPDRIVHHAIMQVLELIWKKTFIKHTYQSIKGRGIHRCKKDIEKVTKSKDVGELFCYKMDIVKFYPSIDNNKLKDIVTKKIKCKNTLAVLYDIIDSTKGVPIGNYLSQFLGNLYLTYFDHYVKEVLKVKWYFRYCDDIVLLATSKEQLVELVPKIKTNLESLGLKVKDNEQIFDVEHRGIDFIGYVFNKRYTLLRKSIKERMMRNLNPVSFCSYYGWLLHCNGYNLLIKYKEKLNESKWK